MLGYWAARGHVVWHTFSTVENKHNIDKRATQMLKSYLTLS